MSEDFYEGFKNDLYHRKIQSAILRGLICCPSLIHRKMRAVVGICMELSRLPNMGSAAGSLTVYVLELPNTICSAEHDCCQSLALPGCHKIGLIQPLWCDSPLQQAGCLKSHVPQHHKTAGETSLPAKFWVFNGASIALNKPLAFTAKCKGKHETKHFIN